MRQINEIKGKKVLVVGLGKSGMATVQALLKLEAKVYVQDAKTEAKLDPRMTAFLKPRADGVFFGQEPPRALSFDLFVLSPGVPPDLPFIQAARRNGTEIVGELELAYRLGYGNFVAITGTNGKTTTTTLTGEIFKNAGRTTFVVGNIGVAVISKAINADPDAWLITETSSFQLETIDSFRPGISAILNLTPDHMDRHKNMEAYGAAKARIFMNQTEEDFCVVNYDDPGVRALTERCPARILRFSRLEDLRPGICVQDGMIVIKDSKGVAIRLCSADELRIPGAHNLENALAAAAIAYAAGITPKTISDTLKSFQGVEHRMELAGEVKGVRFINDSKGTNPDASVKAIEAVNGSIVLIAGGYDKNSDFDQLIKAFRGKVKAMILMGRTAEKIRAAAERARFTDTVTASCMEECVEKAYRRAAEGDTVLLSPACASWDMYACFEERGEHFKQCVRQLKDRESGVKP